ncbi:hypothetical protein B1R32_10460 [Abditibacterium utsteinense]|uniref:Uncharacterized protein n=1 Tax=Abditibacterium utsteinense TaxID=1960156 RepID=A0A2S8SUU0_9BACT|nr:hypothetical protein [Abditibacterium utsteinense]PQV64567.1 hypothetical protein B1R32_10460 [Abditibacterium utsteinense]
MKFLWASFGSGVALCALPLVALLPGCGGGSGGAFSPNPTAFPTATATATATPAATPITLLTEARIDLGNAQTGILAASRSGNAVSGTLTIRNTRTQAAQRGTAALFAVPSGVYPVTGTFSAPRRFTAAGRFPAPVGAFSITGMIYTSTEDGSYTITVGGQTNSGNLPRPGGVFLPTPMPGA